MRAARKALGATQEDIAEALEISTEVYGRMERGATLPSLPTFVKITKVLGVSPNQLLSARNSVAGETTLSYGPAPQMTLTLQQRNVFQMISRADEATTEAMVTAVKAVSTLSRAKSAKPKAKSKKR